MEAAVSGSGRTYDFARIGPSPHLTYQIEPGIAEEHFHAGPREPAGLCVGTDVVFHMIFVFYAMHVSASALCLLTQAAS